MNDGGPVAQDHHPNVGHCAPGGAAQGNLDPVGVGCLRTSADAPQRRLCLVAGDVPDHTCRKLLGGVLLLAGELHGAVCVGVARLAAVARGEG